MLFLPLSIPSPPIEWGILLTVPIGEWLHGILPFISANQVLTVHTYAVCIMLGIIAAGFWTDRRLKARGAEPGILLDIVIWPIFLGLIGARAYHVATHPGDYFFEGSDPWNPANPTSVWAIWSGGNAIIGSLIGGAVGAYIGCRATGLRFWSFADALAPAMLLAQVLGRLGNYFNHELFGAPTALPWGLEIPAPNAAIPVGLPEGTLFHPTFLYEMIWNALGIVVLLVLERRTRPEASGITSSRLQWGTVWALYMVWYGFGRIFFESIRVDPSEVFLGIRSNVWGAFALMVLGLMLFIVQRQQHPGAEPSVYRPGREWSPNSAVDSEATYSEIDEPDDEATESELAATSGSKSRPKKK